MITLALGLLSSCSINKYIPDDKILLVENKVKFKPSELTRRKADREKITYAIPHPRYGLGKGYLHFYFKHSKPSDTTWLDRLFIKKLSERPTWYTVESVEQNKTDLIKHLNASGYFQGKVDSEVKQKNKQASVIYTVSPGKPLRLKSIQYSSTNNHVQRILDSLLPFLKLRVGMPLDEQILIPDEAKIIQTLQDQGYYQINKSNFDYYYEDSTNQYIDLKCSILPPEGVPDFSTFHISEVHVYSYDRLTNPGVQKDTMIDKMIYHSDHNHLVALKPSILNNYIQFSKDSLYSLSAVQKTRSTLQNLGIFRSVSIVPEVSSTDNLKMNVYLPSIKRQYFQVDVESSYVTNKDQTVGNKLFDFRVALQYRHRNLFRGGEQFGFSLIPSIGVQIVDGQLLIPRGLNIQSSLTFPRFIEIGLVKFANNIHLISDKFYNDLKFTTRSRINAAFVYELFFNSFSGPAETSIQRESKISFGYEFTKENRIFYRFNPIGFDYLNYNLSEGFIKAAPPLLIKSFESRLLAGFFFKEISADINNQYNNQNVSRILASIETSGVEVGIADLFSKSSIIPTISRFIRTELDGRYTIRLSNINQVGLRLATGLALPFGNKDNTIPFVRQFYVGGPNSIRGWAIREIGPGTYKNNSRSDSLSFYQTGNVKLEFGSEYRFDIFSILKGAILFDAGNVWLLKKDPSQPGGEFTNKFLSQLYLSSGLGLRLDFNYFIIRFDSGLKLRTPYLQEDGTHWFKTHQLRDLQYNLSLGLPF